MTKTVLPQPWYKEPYVWMIIFFPALAVVAGLFTFRLAMVSNDGLVVDDYYQQGKTINRVLARDDAAAKLGLRAVVQFNWETNAVQVQLTAQEVYQYPAKIKASFMYRTRAGFDKEIELSLISEGLYRANLPKLVLGGWHVALEADNWRLLGTLNPGDTQVEIVAEPSTTPAI